MHIPDQSSDEQEPTTPQQQSETASEVEVQPAIQHDAQAILAQPEAAQVIVPPKIYTPQDAEAIRLGKIYPPPPDFYQGENFSQPQPPLPSAGPRYSNGNASPQNTGNWSPVQPLRPGQPAGLPPGARPYPSPPHAPVKKSSTWIWVTVTVILVAVIATCGLCTWAANTVIGPVLHQSINVITNGIPMTNHYYDALENKEYTQAFSYLATSDISQQQFQQQAQAQDNQYGSIYQYTVGQPSITYGDTTDTTIKSFTVTVKVVRQKKSYSTQLTLRQVGQQWRITNYNSI